ncbi:GntR family transcriptional regulator [Mycolicibacterium chubuense]|uniref:Putative HTH-type transcriptional regulator YdfH n=1 Tax=Mycolicibacterium chubuense TaxID=1800 RepID=A0A0J6VMG2_MYCCU|nr:GntR family transcriptional regulator [Mycolicibacterium chubuense]KMO72215.1 putative HTH-type transcriptional regulator YdfH [Mycolicibacterium chubuense]ORA53015.1 GntR family transcriptional regulator [Mycolicibacterium chubuense]SPX97984.1 GntR family transcriptional regulator [Mycolicibacterium chubuense]
MSQPQVRDGVTGARVADELRNAILHGVHPPGTRLRQEELANQYGASRVPVREALRILESEGLVTTIANAGAWIARLSLDECVELYQVRERIEPLLLRYSLPALTESQIDRLAELADTMHRTRAVERFLELDREFHLGSYAAADTTYLGPTVERLWNTTQHYRRAFTRLLDDESNRIVHDEHHMLVAAIRERDSDEAERVLLGHIRRTRRQLARHPEVFE